MTVLKNTDLLGRTKTDVEFVPFTYGAPMIEAALAGRLDIVFAGDQPVMNLVSKSEDWRIVARMTRYRSAIIVPTNSSLKNLNDLSGKTVATAFGSTTHRDLVRILADEGLTDKVKLVNIDQAEHAGVIAAGGETKWGTIDAIGTYDPTIAVSVSKGTSRILHSWASPGLVAVRAETLEQKYDEVKAFLKAYQESYVWYAEHTKQSNEWYSSESRLALSNQQYADIAAFEPNMQVSGLKDVDISINESFLAQLKKNAKVAEELGIMKQMPDFEKAIEYGLLE